MRTRRRNGAALIVVLLLAATLSMVALSITEFMRRSAERSVALRARNEMLWIAYSVEQLTLSAVKAGIAASPKALTGSEAFINTPLTLPFDSGSATVVILDATRCFNLNSLVSAETDGRSEPSEAAFEMLGALITAVRPQGSASGTALAAAAADWIDPDTFSAPQGAEDGAYLSLKTPRRTAGVLFADPTELRAVLGADGPLFARLRPMVCARQDPGPERFNVNMLQATDAPLLAGLSGGALSVSQAAAVIADRPPGGYATVAEFLSHPLLKERDVATGMRTLSAVTSRNFEARAVINHGGRSLDLTLTIEASQSGRARVVGRRLGPVE